jgi:hypothetical protein
MPEAAKSPLPWWQVILGGVAVAAGTFGLLWAIVILGWALEGGA